MVVDGRHGLDKWMDLYDFFYSVNLFCGAGRGLEGGGVGWGDVEMG